MKKLILPAVIIVYSHLLFAQVRPVTPVNTPVKTATATQVKTIPATRAALIRKNTVQLKLQLTQFNDSVTLVKKDIDDLVSKMKNDLDSMSEMGETESLRLQMAMDRMSKMMSMLSNLMKKISDTSQSITQNLK